MRHPSFSGPASTVSKPNWSSKCGHPGLRILVVAGDHQSAAILRARRLPVGRKLGGIDMIEGLDDLRGWQMRLQEL